MAFERRRVKRRGGKRIRIRAKAFVHTVTSENPRALKEGER
jgi:hypothetical protein